MRVAPWMLLLAPLGRPRGVGVEPAVGVTVGRVGVAHEAEGVGGWNRRRGQRRWRRATVAIGDDEFVARINVGRRPVAENIPDGDPSGVDWATWFPCDRVGAVASKTSASCRDVIPCVRSNSSCWTKWEHSATQDAALLTAKLFPRWGAGSGLARSARMRCQ